MDKNEKALEDAQAHIRSKTDSEDEKFIMREIKTDAKGKFIFEGLLKGQYEIYCGKEKYLWEKIEVNAGDAPLKIILKKSGKLIGKIVNDGDDSPVNNFSIRLKVSSSSKHEFNEDYEGRTEEFEGSKAGSFEIGGLYEEITI